MPNVVDLLVTRTTCNLSKLYEAFNLSKFYEALLEQFVRWDVAILLFFSSNLTTGEVTHVYAIASLA